METIIGDYVGTTIGIHSPLPWALKPQNPYVNPKPLLRNPPFETPTTLKGTPKPLSKYGYKYLHWGFK